MPEKPFHPRQLMADSYYLNVLRSLIEGLKAKLSDRQLAYRLNSDGLPQPNGKPWGAASLKAALFRLRHARTIPNRLHQKLLEFNFDNLITARDARVLLLLRRQQA